MYSMYFHFRWVGLGLKCFICWFGLILLYWVIVNSNIIFISTKTSSICRRIEIAKPVLLCRLLCLISFFVCGTLTFQFVEILHCHSRPKQVSNGLLVTLYFCRKLQFPISRFLDPRWVSSFPHSSMPINYFFPSLFLRCLSVMDFSKCWGSNYAPCFLLDLWELVCIMFLTICCKLRAL